MAVFSLNFSISLRKNLKHEFNSYCHVDIEKYDVYKNLQPERFDPIQTRNFSDRFYCRRVSIERNALLGSGGGSCQTCFIVQKARDSRASGLKFDLSSMKYVIISWTAADVPLHISVHSSLRKTPTPPYLGGLYTLQR